MNYSKIYKSIIKNAQKRKPITGSFYEVHHIIPRSMGGSNSKDNLVKLTPREHFIAHRLLTKMYPTNAGMRIAVFLMAQEGTNSGTGIRVSGRVYCRLRNESRRAKRQMAGHTEDMLQIRIPIRVPRRIISGMPKYKKFFKTEKLMKAANQVMTNLIASIGYEGVTYSRSNASNKMQCFSTRTLIKAIDTLSELGFLVNNVTDVQEKKTSSIKITQKAIDDFDIAFQQSLFYYENPVGIKWRDDLGNVIEKKVNV